MDTTLQQIQILVLVATLVAMLARRLRVPYSVGLVLAGIGLALLPPHLDILLTRGLAFLYAAPSAHF
jgi:CPA1 family monovalent cation:H+ antiporter